MTVMPINAVRFHPDPDQNQDRKKSVARLARGIAYQPAEQQQVKFSEYVHERRRIAREVARAIGLDRWDDHRR